MIAIEAITAIEKARRSPSSRRAIDDDRGEQRDPDEERQRPCKPARQPELITQRNEREADGLDDVA